MAFQLSWPREFRKFWIGQTASAFGSAITQFLLPLLVYRLTGSAVALAIATAATYLPYALFGLLIGAWVDRVDRKRLMVWIDVARAGTIVTVPIAYYLNFLPVDLIYVVTFANSTLAIAYNAGRFAAVPFLIADENRIVAANGHVQAGLSGASLLGPLAAGSLLFVLSPASLLFIDSATFVISACCLAWIDIHFNAPRRRTESHLLADVRVGLEYVWRHPLLRDLSLIAAVTNVFLVNTMGQLVLFAESRLGASGPQIAGLYSAASAGMVVASLLAGRLRRRFAFHHVVLGALFAIGAATFALSLTRSYPVAVLLWAATVGATSLFAINTASLRQIVAPEMMLSRISTVALVMAWSVEPPAALAGGFLIQATNNVAAVYSVSGLVIVAVAIASAFGPVGKAEEYIRMQRPGWQGVSSTGQAPEPRVSKEKTQG